MTASPAADAAPDRHVRRLAVGAEPVAGGTSFRVWAPARREIAVAVDGRPEAALRREASGHFSGFLPGLGAGARYRFRLDGGDALWPDPASRFQPEGPEGPSEIVDPAAFFWRDGGWAGLDLAGQAIVEIHIGTFTPEGSWAAAAERLPHLRDVGYTAVEVMPVADFAGRRGWGYDGVALFAPSRLYGTPDDFRRFVEAAHRLGLGVLLDVVYNHFGPLGACHEQFVPCYLAPHIEGEWGAPLNFDGEGSEGVREFVLANAAMWIAEYRLDGLRLDAVQGIHDRSEPHIVAEIAAAARRAAGDRRILLIGENEPQRACLLRPPEAGGFGLDAVWNDDFHHSALVAVSGRREAYYSDYAGSPQELVSAAKYGYLYQGQLYRWQGKRRGTPARDIDRRRFVDYLDSHDQVANSLGRRFHEATDAGRARAATALLLLAPGTPMLFQGQEFWSTTPFLYFADFDGPLGDSVRDGRRRFLAQFPSIATPEMAARLPDPLAEETFRRCRIDWSEAARRPQALALHRDLLRLRRDEPVFAAQGGHGLDGAVIGPQALALRFFAPDGDDRLLLVNLGADLAPGSIAEPLLAPPEERQWRLLWSSEDPRYGGAGTPPAETPDGWRLPRRSALVLAPASDPSSRPPNGRRAAG